MNAPVSESQAVDQITTKVDGIAHVLSDSLLEIPDYQRSYSWTVDEVAELWRDIEKAMKAGSRDYFLGSIVTTSGSTRDQVIDGQQRLATVSLLFAAMRDIFRARSDERAAEVERDYLGRKNMATRLWEPKLKLNADDNNVFQLLISGDRVQAGVVVSRESHKALLAAYDELYKRLAKTIEGLPAESWQEPLVRWHDYLLRSANLIRVGVSSESRAFVIFETLNDRGLNLSTSDLLKGHLFGTAIDRLEECKISWAVAMAPFIGSDSGATDTFLRHYWSSREGVSRVKALFSQIRDSVDSADDAVSLSRELAAAAPLWASMFERDAIFWKDYPDSSRAALEVLGNLKVEQCRPLLLAVMRRLQADEVQRVLGLIVAWSIRWFVVGGGGAGVTERLYAETAKRVTEGSIVSAQRVAAEFAERVPSDQEFRSMFATHSVRRGWLARYYLLALERQLAGDSEPELVPNANRDEVNLEHVLARNASRQDWLTFSDDEFDDMKLMLGNQCLLRKSANNSLGNGNFATKRQTLAESDLALTREIGQLEDWTPARLLERQARMADAAVSVWPRSLS